MIEALLGSHVKAGILIYLGLKGGTSGRQLARALNIHTTQIFKALKQLRAAKIVAHYGSFYALDPFHPFHDELLRMVWKETAKNKKWARRIFPIIPEDRRIDPLAVYELASLRKETIPYPKLSDVLREKYG